ncbi:MAG: hypothetical protein MUE40_01195 [Anaerolineae bacterium]|nr:hypothetical protein [Anaerolineae bacterium]
MTLVREMDSTLDLALVDDYIARIRAASPATIVEQAAAWLRDGVPEAVLWAAAALTACHYIKNEAHNVLGFVSHAMIACEDARCLAQGQKTATRHLLLIQAIHQVVFDLHDPCVSPYELLPGRPLYDATLDDALKMLRMDVRLGEYLRVDARLLALEQQLPRAELIDLLLDIGLEGMITDDHTLITPSLVLGLIDLVGWERGFDMLRCALRYSASFQRDFRYYDRAVALRAQYGLEDGAAVSAYQPERIEALRAALLAAPAHDRPELAARAMGQQGYSAATVLAAVTLAGADMYLRAVPVPHQDFDAVSREVAPMHLNTSTHALRKMLPFMSPRTQALAAIQGGSLLERGPSILSEVFEFVPFESGCLADGAAYPFAPAVAALAHLAPAALIDRLHTALPAHDYATATAAVAAYAGHHADPAPLIAALTEVACSDDGTLMHSVKHLNAMTAEFNGSDHPDRWRYLVGAARFIAWYAGLNTGAYRRAQAVLAAG